MELIKYFDLFFNGDIHGAFKKSDYKTFTDYVTNEFGLKAIYTSLDGSDFPILLGYSIKDGKKWMVTKIKYGINI